MLADTFAPEVKRKLGDLTARCCDLGGFRVDDNGHIQGVFHRPLLHLAMELGLDGYVEGRLTGKALRQALDRDRFAILSVELARVQAGMSGGHLVLVHSYDTGSEEFILHDCSEVLGCRGANVRIESVRLEHYSNQKGLIVWPRPKSGAG